MAPCRVPDFRSPLSTRAKILLATGVAGVLAVTGAAVVVSDGGDGGGGGDREAVAGPTSGTDAPVAAPPADESLIAPSPDESVVPPSPTGERDAADGGSGGDSGDAADGGGDAAGEGGTGGGGARPAGGGAPIRAGLFVNPGGQVSRWVADNPQDGRRPVIAEEIADEPQGVWFTRYDPDGVTGEVRAVTSAAEASGDVPVLVSYVLPSRDCGGHSGGGAPDTAAYGHWMERFAAGLGNGPVMVILEPDSLALNDCMTPDAKHARDAALAHAADTLHAANPRARVYFDAGHSQWHDPADMAARLRAAGARESADGIFTNVANFRTTADETAYAKDVLAALGGGLHAVIDTSRNGNGPVGEEWCDPGGRRLGERPTTDTGDPAIAAYLWVKPPGEADGCAAAPGTFSPEIAYHLALGD
ncbi:glycoside hydrolase family 6 protein [Streptomyces sp. NPDC049881]|uniref:glycoside hydrolase family 6 protein n=1 Tax=Streptomyces sp. NPDC049881 TaxID=3155778 RepID=UPI003412F3F7